MPLTVCHVCSAHPAEDGRVFDRACVSLAEVGYVVHLVARSHSDEVYEMRGVKIHPTPNSRSRWERLYNRHRIARMAARLQPDLYHVHEPELLGPVLAISRDKPVIWDVHEPYLDYLSAKAWIPVPLRSLARIFWDWRERRLVRKCATVITAVESLASRYRQIHKRVSVIHNFPRIDGDSHPEPIDKLDSNNALVFTGTISKNRGIEEVIKAMGLLCKEGIQTSLHLAGTLFVGSYIDELTGIADQYGVKDSITYYGVLTKQEATALQLRCAIGLNVSNNGMYPVQGYPVKMFEFMRAQLPVIYSNIPSFQEIAGTSRAGIEVEPGDIGQIANAIKRLIQNPILAAQLGANGKKAVDEKFNWNIERTKLIRLYQELLDSNTGV